MDTNIASWIDRKHAALDVRPAPWPVPAPDQVVVRVRAVAVNPLDWIVQAHGGLTYRWLTYPAVLGTDLAGEVVETGSAVGRLRAGDRVLALAVGTDKDVDRPAEGAFALHVAVSEALTTVLPETVTFEEAATLPLAVATASTALFAPDQLNLGLPGSGGNDQEQSVLVWGGSTSVGSQAVQLAAAAGYRVVATASPKNADYVRDLGAQEVLDYRDPRVVHALVRALRGRPLAGSIALGSNAAAACVRVAGALPGSGNVAVGTPPVDMAQLADAPRLRRLGMTAHMVSSSVGLLLGARRARVRLRFITGTDLKKSDLGATVFAGYLGPALAEERHRVRPCPTVVGHGLEQVQVAMDRQRAGVSAAKLVVTV